VGPNESIKRGQIKLTNALDAAMNLLGHKSIKTTEKAYAKFTEGRKDQVRDALRKVRESEKSNKLD